MDELINGCIAACKNLAMYLSEVFDNLYQSIIHVFRQMVTKAKVVLDTLDWGYDNHKLTEQIRSRKDLDRRQKLLRGNRFVPHF